MTGYVCVCVHKASCLFSLISEPVIKNFDKEFSFSKTYYIFINFLSISYILNSFIKLESI